MELLDACIRIAATQSDRSMLPVPFLWHLPTPNNLLLAKARRTLLQNVDELIEARMRAMGANGGRPVARLDNLIKAAEEDEGGLSPSELRDQI